MIQKTAIAQTLHSLFSRLDALSLEPDFHLQRERAVSYVLRPYLTPGQEIPLAPLPEEVELAKLYLYADYFPDDGHFSLVEQVRDQISEHISDEERAWLDPIRHSYIDLLEITAIGSAGAPQDLSLRSLGDNVEYCVPSGSFAQVHTPGQMVLTRLIRRPELTACPGVAVSLSHRYGQELYESVKQLQREIEAVSGSFELGEWPEFAKRYGHLLHWTLAGLRLKVLLEADKQIRYVTQDGQTFLQAFVLYEHDDYAFFENTLNQMVGLEPQPDGVQKVSQADVNLANKKAGKTQVWTQRSAHEPKENLAICTRLTLTRTQLFLECESQEKLDEWKHQLASTLGFSLHCRGESMKLPSHSLREINLLTEDVPSTTVEITKEEEYRLLSAFFETAYLEWAERPCPALKGESPRHYVSTTNDQERVATLIDEIEREDVALLRTGKLGFDYNSLRGHVGLR